MGWSGVMPNLRSIMKLGKGDVRKELKSAKKARREVKVVG
jgi:hypothetical protein